MPTLWKLQKLAKEETSDNLVGHRQLYHRADSFRQPRVWRTVEMRAGGGNTEDEELRTGTIFRPL
jgi:hypothetical protein